jgi:hypothetical protein
MRVRRLVPVALGLVFFAGLEGGQYFLNNRLQELALLTLFGLFAYGAVHTAVGDRGLRWDPWFWSGPLLIAYIMGSSAAVFALNAGVSPIPSLLAAREFFFILIAPTVYFLYRLGLPLSTIERTFIAVLVLLALNYLFFYFTVDLEAAFFSDGYMFYLVTWDPWRGFRLKPTSFALMLLTLIAGFHALHRGHEGHKLGWLGVLGLTGYIWFLIKARSLMASMMLGVIGYLLLFSRPNRLHLLVAGLPWGLIALAPLSQLVVAHFLGADGGEVRAAAYATAWETIQRHPFLGYGQSSGYSKTYQDIFGPKFFPSDLGLMGIWFKYGTLGLLLYLGVHITTLVRLIRANWLFRRAYGRHNTLLWSMQVLMLALTVNLVLNPGLAFAQGITVAATAWALTAAHADQIRRHPAADPGERP